MEIPCTRLQWTAWVGNNIDELRVRMRKNEAACRRRTFNTRLCPRPGLPAPVQRFQPQAEISRVTSVWAKLLEWRTGWDGFQSDAGRRMFYVLRHLHTTYVIDIECQRVPGTRPYQVRKDYRLTDNIMPLSKFELQFTAHTVSNVFKFYVEGSGATDQPQAVCTFGLCRQR